MLERALYSIILGNIVSTLVFCVEEFRIQTAYNIVVHVLVVYNNDF